MSQQQNSLIDNGDFNIFYISHNNDNGANATIYTNLPTIAVGASGRRNSVWVRSLIMATQNQIKR
jgi:hypothetical protein